LSTDNFSPILAVNPQVKSSNICLFSSLVARYIEHAPQNNPQTAIRSASHIIIHLCHSNRIKYAIIFNYKVITKRKQRFMYLKVVDAGKYLFLSPLFCLSRYNNLNEESGGKQK
jgi:hypothetical protein